MISLDTFKKCMLAIQHQEEKDKQLTDLLVDKSSYGWINTGEELISAMRTLLKDNLNDQYDYIDWWLYDVDEGHRTVWYTHEDLEIEYNIEDLDSLYYYIIGEYSRVPQKTTKTKQVHKKDTQFKTSSIKEIFNNF